MIGDYLGMNIFLANQTLLKSCCTKMFSEPSPYITRTDSTNVTIAALGTIFSATDSVCVLQVGCFLYHPHWSCSLRSSWISVRK